MAHKAYYLPAIGKHDPSKGGFVTEEDAWCYVDTQVCDDCLKGLYHSPCYAEWSVCDENKN